MKSIKIFAIAAVATAMLASCTSAPKVDAPRPSQSEIDSVSYLIGVNFGYFIQSNNFAETLSELNMSQIKNGIADFLAAKGEPGTPEFEAGFKINPDEMNRLFNEFLAKRANYIAAVNRAEGEAFLESIYNKGGVEKTESGLLYEIIEPGNDVKPGPTDKVSVYYTGTLIDGTKFDGTEADQEPVSFTLDRVIEGWGEGLQLIGEGGKIKLYIPSELAYGERSVSAEIKPNSTLIFDVELVSVEVLPVEE